MSNGMSCRNIYYGGGHSNSVSECLCGVLPADLNLHAHTHIYIAQQQVETTMHLASAILGPTRSNPFHLLIPVAPLAGDIRPSRQCHHLASPMDPCGFLDNRLMVKRHGFFCSRKWPSRPIEMRKINK